MLANVFSQPSTHIHAAIDSLKSIRSTIEMTGMLGDPLTQLEEQTSVVIAQLEALKRMVNSMDNLLYTLQNTAQALDGQPATVKDFLGRKAPTDGVFIVPARVAKVGVARS